MKIRQITLLIIVAFQFACNSGSDTGRLTIRLTDSPGDYEEVNIDLQSVQVNADEGENGEQGWVDAGEYNMYYLLGSLDLVPNEKDCLSRPTATSEEPSSFPYPLTRSTYSPKQFISFRAHTSQEPIFVRDVSEQAESIVLGWVIWDTSCALYRAKKGVSGSN